MTRPVRLLVAGIAAFFVALVAGLPASAAIGWLAPDAVRTNGVAGTLWQGSALAISVGNLRLGETRWAISPLNLLLGQLAGSVTARLGDGTAKGDVSVGISGTFACIACSFEGRVANLRSLIPALNAIDGQIEIEIEAVEIRDAWPTRLVGVASLSDVPLGPTGGTNIPPGSFLVSVNSDPVADDGSIEATIEDAGGPVEVSARLAVAPPGTFTFAGRAKGRPDAPAAVVNALGMLGPKGSDGATQLSLSGTF